MNFKYKFKIDSVLEFGIFQPEYILWQLLFLS